ncbi:hypothetical protein SAMN02745165_00762 [Malonomonas rubra DSM 5091]|uniref:SpoIIAA-like n=1 Tax=Malonomonas rubra DSM 5091 TaxID=1122189 RepID=A0A1M6DPN5_MALRU|nr:hypothetical protein [Malonomonas rubra]SHI75181.1 hypothetical protein SAMN02745165_00762 [Malonomonas rubra DSM 5091]
MPLSYSILPEEKLVYVKGSGVVDYNDLNDHLEDLARDPGYQAPMKKLIDYRSLVVLALNKVEAEKFNRLKEQYNDIFVKERCAVVSSADLTYRSTRNHSMEIDPQVAYTYVFKDIHPALEWLEVKHLAEKLLAIGCPLQEPEECCC